MLWQEKAKTKLGKFLHKYDIPQSELHKWTNKYVSQTMISRMCVEKEYTPTTDKVNAILKALRKNVDKSVKYEDFWM